MGKKFNPEKLNLIYCVEYISNSEETEEHSFCDREGICRCEVITNVDITNVKVFEIFDKIINYLTFKKKNYEQLDEETKTSILEIIINEGIEDVSNYTWEAEGDYYGEVVSGIYFDKMEQLLDRVKKILYK